MLASVGSDGQLCLTPMDPAKGAVRYSWQATLERGLASHFVAGAATSCVGVTASQMEEQVLVWSLPRGDCLQVVQLSSGGSMFYRHKFDIMGLAVSRDGSAIAASNSCLLYTSPSPRDRG